MHVLIGLLILLGIAWTLAYKRISPIKWTIVFAIVLGFYSMFGLLTWYILAPVWLIFIAAAAIFNLPQLRYPLLSKKIYEFVKRQSPPISPTEQEALDAGDIWWEADLFRGQPDWEKLHAIPKPELSAEERVFLDNEVEILCQMLNDWKIVHELNDLPAEVWTYLKDKGFFGLVIDKKYGGKGFSAYAHSTIVSKIATKSVTAAVTIMVPNSLGPAELLQHYGTNSQKEYYLPRLAKGQDIPCFGLTSLHAGSDAASIEDTGIICKGNLDGKEVLGIKLNFNKRYITLAPRATVMGLAFKISDPLRLLGEEENLGITVALLPLPSSGVEVGARHNPMGLSFLNGPVRGKDVFIPLDAVIGGAPMLGQGWRMLMECLSIGRGISLPALATASGKLCYRMTGAYAKIRRQFKVSIGSFEGVQEALARIGGLTYMAEACRRLSAQAVVQGVRPAIVSAITKYHLTEFGRQIVNDALDVHAGRGIQLGPNNYLANGYLGVPISITVEGANILTRNLIIFGQGAMRCHPYVYDELKAVNEPDEAKSLQKFDKLLCQHIGYLVSNFARSLFHGLSNSILLKPKFKTPVSKYYRELARMSAAFAFVADVAMMILGGNLKRKEALSARLGDVLSHLYLGSAVLKYFHDEGQPLEDLPYVEWCVQTNLYKIQQAFTEFFTNFPNKWLAGFLNFVVFPLDRNFKAPAKDNLAHALTASMMTPNAQRDRISQFCYVGQSIDEPTGLIEITLHKVIACEKTLKKVHDAIKTNKLVADKDQRLLYAQAVQASIIDQEECQALLEMLELVDKAIAVDEFQAKH